MSVLTIDLDAIIANWRLLNGMVASNVAAVIKADAYGLGASEVGVTLYRDGCRHFFFATLQEARCSRQYLPLDATCYVLHGVPKAAETVYSEYNLIPVLSSLAAIKSWVEWNNINGSQLPCVIKIDTGMTRLGLSESELDDFFVSKTLVSALNPVLFMSHLACADEPNHTLNQQQLQSFASASASIRERYPDVKLSLANSAGVFLGADYHHDMARVGAALYGVHPTRTMDSGLKHVVRLSLSVIHLRSVKEAVTVGYGAAGEVSGGQILAVAAGGYADSLHRILAQGGVGLCCDIVVPVVGRVSMDTVVFDVTAVPGISDWLVGDIAMLPFTIDVINDDLSVSKLSHKNNSIGYEVLTSLSSGRYERRYLSNGVETFV